MRRLAVEQKTLLFAYTVVTLNITHTNPYQHQKLGLDFLQLNKMKT